MSLPRLAAGQTSPLVVVMGTCSTDPDAYVGKDIHLGQSVEWQISDDVPGRRGSSTDFVDPLEAFGAIRADKRSGVFISAQEAAVFMRDLILRLSGTELAALDVTPDAPFYTSDLSIDPGAQETAFTVLRSALEEAGMGELAAEARTLLDAVSKPGGALPDSPSNEDAMGFFSAMHPSTIARFRKSFTAALEPHLPGQLTAGVSEERAETPLEELKALAEILGKGKTSVTVHFDGENGDDEISLPADDGFYSQTYGDRLMALADVILVAEMGPSWADDAGATGRIIFDREGAFISGDDRRGDWTMERAFEEDNLEDVEWPEHEGAQLDM